jgi:cysteine desulfurase
VSDRLIYLDHAATTPVRDDVAAAMWPYFTTAFGNPSSVHGAGARAHEAMEHARAMAAGVLKARPGEIVFTSGGTESDTLAIVGAARALRQRGRHVLTTAIEHAAVLEACRALTREGFDVTFLPVDGDGLVDPDRVMDAVRPDTVLASIMLANNEVGTIQPLAEIAAALRTRGVIVHSDAVQAGGALDLDVDRLGVDLLTLSAHKIYGPKGAGLLYVRRGTQLEPLFPGGGQERGRRGGTENVPGAVGLAVALHLAATEREEETLRLERLRDRLIDGVLLRVPGVRLTGHRVKRLPGHASFTVHGINAEALLVDLDIAGIACSSGSACHAGATDPSHVLLALGLPPEVARTGLRLTLGRDTTQADIDRVLEVLPDSVAALRSGEAV